MAKPNAVLSLYASESIKEAISFSPDSAFSLFAI